MKAFAGLSLVSRMRSRSDAKTLLLAAVALVLGGQSLLALAGARPADSLPLYVGAFILVIMLCGGQACVGVSPALTAGETRSANVLRDRRLVRVVLSASLLLAGGALALFWRGGHDDWGWTLHVLSIAVLLAGAVAPAWRRASLAALRSESLRDIVRQRWAAWLLLLLILAVALMARVWNNGNIPPGLYYDEAREGVTARLVLSDPRFRPVYIGYIERPAAHAFLEALSFTLFGDSISSLRLVSAAFGFLNVLAAYLLFTRWFGNRIVAGLIAAGLWAALRYDITFSRIVFDGIATPFFVMLTLFFLDRGFASGRKADFVLAGLTLGFGQAFYLPMRIFALLLVGLGFCLAAGRWWRERSLAFLKPWVPHLLLAVLALLLITAPIIEFAVQFPTVFFDRSVSASIFASRAEPNLLIALFNTTLKHLAMFNLSGDQIARHNLPGAPMLDTLSGLLFLFGILLAVRHWRNPRNFVMLVLFAGMLQAGIFSTDWEAPQALRSIGVLPSVIYFVTLALVTIGGTLARWSRQVRASRGGRMVVATALPFAMVTGAVLVIGWVNLDTYFNHQATDIQVWKAHSPGEVWTASEMRRLAPNYEVILTQRYFGSATIRYLAPDIAPAGYFTATDALPLSPAPAGPAVLFIDFTLKDQVARARQAYPNAQVRELRPPDNSDPVTYEFILER